MTSSHLIMKRLTSLILIVSFIIISCVAVDPKPLPQRFTQAWTLTYQSEAYCSGKIFYDQPNLSQKISIVDTKDQPCCDLFDQDTQSCAFMQIKNRLYGILTDVKICCYFDIDEAIILPRDIFNYFNYTGQKTIDGQKYYRWVLDFDIDFMDAAIFIYTDETDKRIMKKIQFGDPDEGDVVNLDFWQGSYSEKFSSTNFEVPKYCVSQDQCPYTMSKENLIKKLLISKLMKLSKQSSIRSE